MAYKNLMAELGRNGLTKQAFQTLLSENGCAISYQKLCRQLRGETEISYGQALLMSRLLGCGIEYIMSKEE